MSPETPGAIIAAAAARTRSYTENKEIPSSEQSNGACYEDQLWINLDIALAQLRHAALQLIVLLSQSANLVLEHKLLPKAGQVVNVA
jgi:hypothetical protein